MKSSIVLMASVLAFAGTASAEAVFVERAKIAYGDNLKAETLTSLVADKINSMPGQRVVGPKDAALTLRPKATRIGEAYVISVEKIQNGELVGLTQGKAKTIEDVDRAVAKAVDEAIIGRPAPMREGPAVSEMEPPYPHYDLRGPVDGPEHDRRAEGARPVPPPVRR